MSSKRGLRRRQCKGKVQHRTVAQALAALGWHARHGDPRMTWYACRWCKGYHIGH